MENPKITFSASVSVDTLKRLIAAMEAHGVPAVEFLMDERTLEATVRALEQRTVPEVSVEESLDRE